MNIADLTSKIEANKKPLAIAGAVAVGGLALMQRQKAGGDVGTTSATTPSAGATPAAIGGLATPNGQVVYSSEASDVYNAIQPQLSTIGTAMNQLLSDKATANSDDSIPIAARLNAPSGTGQFVGWKGNGYVTEVQSDGSLYHLTPSEWAAATASGAKLVQMQGNSGVSDSGPENLLAKVRAAQTKVTGG